MTGSTAAGQASATRQASRNLPRAEQRRRPAAWRNASRPEASCSVAFGAIGCGCSRNPSEGALKRKKPAAPFGAAGQDFSDRIDQGGGIFDDGGSATTVE